MCNVWADDACNGLGLQHALVGEVLEMPTQTRQVLVAIGSQDAQRPEYGHRQTPVLDSQRLNKNVLDGECMILGGEATAPAGVRFQRDRGDVPAARSSTGHCSYKDVRDARPPCRARKRPFRCGNAPTHRRITASMLSAVRVGPTANNAAVKSKHWCAWNGVFIASMHPVMLSSTAWSTVPVCRRHNIKETMASGL